MFSRLVHTYRRAFSGLPREVWLLCLVTLVHRSGTMVLPFLGLYLTSQIGLSPSQAGGILGLYGVGAIVGGYVGGWLTDRLGTKVTQCLTLSLAGLGFFALARVESVVEIATVVFLLSIAAEGFRPANATALADESSPETRFRAFALSRLSINLGMTFGPAAGGFLARYDYTWLFLCDGGTCLLAAGLVFWFRRPRPTSPIPAATPGELPPVLAPWHDTFYMLLLAFVVLLTTLLFQLLGTYPLTLHEVYGFSESTIGLLLAINTLVIVVFEMVLVDAVSGLRPLRIVGVGAGLLGVGLGLLIFGSSIPYIAFTILVWTAGEMLAFPFLEGVIANRAPETNRGRYLGLLTAAFSLAFILAPVAGMWVYQELGYRSVWIGCGILGLLLVPSFYWLDRQLQRQSGLSSPP